MKSENKTFTYQTRLKLSKEQEAILNDYAELMGRVERTLFAKVTAKYNLNELKVLFLKKFQITARQFNSCKVQVEGKIESIKKLRVLQIQESKNRILSLEKKLGKTKKSLNPLNEHQKNRRLYNLKSRLNKLMSDHENEIVKICFGSKKLFSAQFNLKENGFNSHAEWQSAWRKSRSSQFFLLGSKDETAGNQSCVASLENHSINLRVRLPDALNRHGKYLNLTDISFKYGQNTIIKALENCSARKTLNKLKDLSFKECGQAISYRFKKDKKGWLLFVSTSLEVPTIITKEHIGVIGIDINADHLAITETDRYGNPIFHKSIQLNTYGKSSFQTQALIGDAVAKIVNIAISNQKPLVIEKLDFQRKKSDLRELGFKKHSRMLSSLAYSSVINHIKSRCYRFGVKVQEVNPAYTSVIGLVKFAKRYGLTIHESAALAIARRFQKFSERLPSCLDKISDGKNGHVALSLPARNRDKHVWSSWGLIRKKLSVVLAAHFRAIKKRSSKPANPVY